MNARPFALSLVLMVATVVAGLSIRFGHLGLPPFVVKYGGSMLWAVLIYWIISTIFPAWRIAAAVLVAGSVATAVELVKLYHAPDLDAFRLTWPGIVLLGRVFSVWDIVAYWLAISVGGLVDWRFRLLPGFGEMRRG